MNKETLIIDTDPGIDDAVAITIATNSDALHIPLITTVAGNVNIDKTTNNARRLLAFLGKDHIPVARGCDRPLIQDPLPDASNVHGESGMDGWTFPTPTAPLAPVHAVEALRQTILANPTPVTLLPIGPLTNIALLLRMYPEVKANISRIVFMGGSLNRGNHGVMSEFNINIDPDAAHIVFNSGLPLVMVGLDIGQKAVLFEEDCTAIRDNNTTGNMVYSLFKHYRSGSFATGLRVYDPTAVAYVLAPHLFTTVEAFGTVEIHGTFTRGCTVIDLNNYLGKQPNITVLTDVDAPAFRKWMIEQLSHC